MTKLFRFTTVAATTCAVASASSGVENPSNQSQTAGKSLRGLTEEGNSRNLGTRFCATDGCNTGYLADAPCQCNENCDFYRNCCSDFAEICKPATTASSVGGHSCANDGCDLPYKPWMPCQCNRQCSMYSNCCGDYEAVCNASPSPAAPAPPGAPVPAAPSPVPAPVAPNQGYVPTGTPPADAMSYKGMAWPDTVIGGTGVKHFFAVGDWGGLDGSLQTQGGRPRLIAYAGGHTAGPHVFPRNRWDKAHSELLCTHDQFVECYGSHGQSDQCVAGCGYVDGVDNKAQILVADAMKARAAKVNPEFIVNVGDNFYWGGIEVDCGYSMASMSGTAQHQFNQVFEGVYQGSGLSGKKWFSVLGNHDWGGRQFNNGWDQQIAYTWKSSRWVMPAPYYSTRIVFQDLGFDIDLYMIDSNVEDAKSPDEDPEHNICGRAHNPASASCDHAGGPASIEACPGFFQSLMKEQQTWLEGKLASSTATWQMVNTHFPCGHQSWWYRQLKTQYGLDLLITGHRHDQELWANSGMLGGLTCIVTGGGGGISSEASPGDDRSHWYGEAQYGFYDITISKYQLHIESINYDGKTIRSHTVYPH